MTSDDANSDPRLDRLYRLLPAIYRARDAETGYGLQALLRVVAEQVNVVEDDIAQLYENWFIETADDWAVPYLADLLGYQPVAGAGEPGSPATAEGRALDRVLVPRREVANTIRYRRRKGTLALLDSLAADVAGWPARAVEFYRLLGWNQNLNHQHPHRARTVDVRRSSDLGLVGGPFDPLARTVDVRRVNSHRTPGLYNIPSLGVFVWRLKSYSVTHAPANDVEGVGSNCYTFSALGQDSPLFVHPEPGAHPPLVTSSVNVPARIRRVAFEQRKNRFYGPGKSLVIYADGWADLGPGEPVPLSAIVPADLTDWQYKPVEDTVAVDPVLGRFVFPPGQEPEKGVRVTYHYGFSADMGGGEYPRRLFDPAARPAGAPDGRDPATPLAAEVRPRLYQVSASPAPATPEQEASLHPGFEGSVPHFHTLHAALRQWEHDKPLDAVIEIIDSGVYVEPVDLRLDTGRTLQIRAASGTRPVIRLLDWQTDRPDALTVNLAEGSRFTLDGLVVTGRPVHFRGPSRPAHPESPAPVCGAEVNIRHCTLVPGWGLNCDCEPLRPTEPSLELFDLRARLHIEHSIVGSIQINEDAVRTDPIPVCITDSILDATGPEKEALGAPGRPAAHATLTIRRCTVFGIVNVHAVELAENCLFNNCLNVVRRQIGCMRFCHVPAGCRTPRRYHCQPDLVAAAVPLTPPGGDPAVREQLVEDERRRVRPQYTSIRYGEPAYAQLALTCADEIRRGADDESEMGAFHDLFQPQREANLLARLEEYTPAGMDAGLIFTT